MVDYTTPVTTTFELQRQSIRQGQDAFEQGIQFQKQFNQAIIEGLVEQESAQRRTVELQQDAIHNTLDVVETNVPGAESVTDDVREAVNEQFELLLENHSEAFENVATELENGANAYEEFATDYLDALNEQLKLVIEAHEDLEAQSVEAAEQVAEQFEALQAQVEDVQDQVREVQEQAVEPVES